MVEITVEEAQARLVELVRRLGPGEEIVITEGARAVGKLVGLGAAPRRRGSAKGMEEDEEHLKDFEEYMG